MPGKFQPSHPHNAAILRMLVEHGGFVPVSRIAQRFPDVGVSTIYMRCNRMIAHGWVSRDPDGGFRIAVTAIGRALVANGCQRINDVTVRARAAKPVPQIASEAYRVVRARAPISGGEVVAEVAERLGIPASRVVPAIGRLTFKGYCEWVDSRRKQWGLLRLGPVVPWLHGEEKPAPRGTELKDADKRILERLVAGAATGSDIAVAVGLGHHAIGGRLCRLQRLGHVVRTGNLWAAR